MMYMHIPLIIRHVVTTLRSHRVRGTEGLRNAGARTFRGLKAQNMYSPV